MIYDLMYLTALLVCFPWFIFKALSGKKYRAGLKEKFGFLSVRKKPDGKSIWFHCVSVGETLAAAGIISEFKKRNPGYSIVLSTTTNTGREIAEKKIQADVFVYYPFDLSFAVSRFLNILHPSAIILVELEVWPNMVRQAVKRNIPIGVINGRLSEKSFKGFKRWNALVRKTFSLLDFCGVQDETYLERFISSGSAKETSVVTGNLKYDSLSENPDPEKRKELKALLQIHEGDSILLGGSTHEGEEELLIDAYKLLKKSHPSLRLILVPRHPERLDAVKSLIQRKELDYICRTELNGESGDIADKVILVDTMGELSVLYSVSSAAFVGGSFSGTGGHNIMEPVIFRKPVLTGPSTFNFKEDMDRLLKEKGIIQVETGEQLQKALSELLENPEKADIIGENGYNTVIKYRGAVEENISLIEKHIIKES